MDIAQLDLATLGPVALRMLVAVAGAVLVLAGFWIAAWIVGAIIRRVAREGGQRRDVINLLGTATRWSILGFGMVTALGTLGVDTTGLIAGLGLTGFALGFALRDIISSTLAGVLILLNHPFVAGDRIRVAGVEGVVLAIELRYTAMLDDAGQRHLVPNSKALAEIVTIVPRPPRTPAPMP